MLISNIFGQILPTEILFAQFWACPWYKLLHVAPNWKQLSTIRPIDCEHQPLPYTLFMHLWESQCRAGVLWKHAVLGRASSPLLIFLSPQTLISALATCLSILVVGFFFSLLYVLSDNIPSSFSSYPLLSMTTVELLLSAGKMTMLSSPLRSLTALRRCPGSCTWGVRLSEGQCWCGILASLLSECLHSEQCMASVLTMMVVFILVELRNGYNLKLSCMKQSQCCTNHRVNWLYK